MHIAILTFEGFNELDSLIAFGILNRIKRPGWRVSLASPGETIVSMNGALLLRQLPLEEIDGCEAVLVGSGSKTREIAEDASIMQVLARLDPARQLIGAQCSGTLLLAKLGLLEGIPACTDLLTRPWVMEAGVEVREQPFFARGNLATAGGCLASSYLAAWLLVRLLGREAAAEALHYVAPVGEKEAFVERALGHVAPFIP
ncbi:AraC family transcriptional regulator [Stutzerimonas nosocomialis]|uniref:AraC family transcriptional regulator n=1 Tax=Stutzerimonas nosocomialis TaxID=1056496 RepID=A0A5R9QG50_9GAMM|nr:DJ-1/PfpI family protein [Stutzerimonas nosocomialis]TLX54345.1 AraC family transcriptional regulator [Stutzerimonas nosocomialis]TLX56186.1 AraC family transcriptional regulator [Stutzerimonas nosocomialis]TLX64020.1 AraC family transcriptional regulator [Stutzerimonas nosocomialis]